MLLYIKRNFNLEKGYTITAKSIQFHLLLLHYCTIQNMLEY